jgi:hypothetical protein
MAIVFPYKEAGALQPSPFSTFLQSRSIFFYEVFLVENLAAVPPKMANAAKISLDVLVRPAVLGYLGS